jgi:hypothetical protein
MQDFILQAEAPSILALFETNKEQRQSFVKNVLSNIESGEANPLKIHLQVKNMEQCIKMLTDDPQYKEAVLEEAGKHGGKSFDFHNAKIEVKEVGVKYDFSNCGDAKMAKLHEELEALKKKVKDREDFLKKAPIEGTPVLDEDTAELVTIYPPSKSSTTSVAVTLK